MTLTFCRRLLAAIIFYVGIFYRVCVLYLRNKTIEFKKSKTKFEIVVSIGFAIQ